VPPVLRWSRAIALYRYKGRIASRLPFSNHTAIFQTTKNTSSNFHVCLRPLLRTRHVCASVSSWTQHYHQILHATYLCALQKTFNTRHRTMLLPSLSGSVWHQSSKQPAPRFLPPKVFIISTYWVRPAVCYSSPVWVKLFSISVRLIAVTCVASRVSMKAAPNLCVSTQTPSFFTQKLGYARQISAFVLSRNAYKNIPCCPVLSFPLLPRSPRPVLLLLLHLQTVHSSICPET